jgi:hypothetical protein
MIRKSSVFTLISGLIVGLVACGGGNNGGGSGGAVTAKITASPSTVDRGQAVKMTWSSTNATSCLATSAPAESDWTALVATSGSATVTPESYAGEIYSLTCAGSGSSSATASVSVTVNSAAVAIENPTNGKGVPSNFWATQNCALNRFTITSVTVLNGQPWGQTIFVGPAEGYGYNPNGPGGFYGYWNATVDGTGLLIPTYNPSNACLSRWNLPVSMLNIAGSTASGSFDAELVDGSGATTSCSFALVPPTGNAPSYQELGCE